jgi:ClpP class serine protease
LIHPRHFRPMMADSIEDESAWRRLTGRIRRWFPGGPGSAPVIPVVRLTGTIGKMTRLRSGLTLSTVAPVLKKAFSLKRAPAVVLVIDFARRLARASHLIYKRIRTLAAEKNKTVIVFVEDVCASGGYMIACAGDEIVVDPASIVGSIGVVSAGFGFVEALQKLGIQRRVYTSGESKVILDPFQPEKPRTSPASRRSRRRSTTSSSTWSAPRGDVLANNPDIFSGMFWSGKTAVSLGLADRTGDLRAVLQERYGEDVRLKPFSAERNVFGPSRRRRGRFRHGPCRDAAGRRRRSRDARSLQALAKCSLS